MSKIDARKEIRRAVDSGKVLFGARESEKSILNGEAQLVIICNNAPEQLKQKVSVQAQSAGIALYEFPETGLELGAVCGKPFVVSVMTVIDAGKSNTKELAKAKK